MEVNKGKNWHKIKMKKGTRINLQLSLRCWNSDMFFSCVWHVIAAGFGKVKCVYSSGFLEWARLRSVELTQVKCACNREEKGVQMWAVWASCSALGTDLFRLSMFLFSWCFAFQVWHGKWESWLVLGCLSYIWSHQVSKGVFRCRKVSLINYLSEVCGKWKALV